MYVMLKVQFLRSFRVDKILYTNFTFGLFMPISYSCSQDNATAMNRLLGPTTFLPLVDGYIPLSAFYQKHKQTCGHISTISLLYRAPCGKM